MSSKTNCAAVSGKDHGAKEITKAANFQEAECQNSAPAATHYWDRHANCIAPMRDLRGAV